MESIAALGIFRPSSPLYEAEGKILGVRDEVDREDEEFLDAFSKREEKDFFAEVEGAAEGI